MIPKALPRQHVVPHGKGWAIRPEGSTRATAIFRSKRDAIDRAREIAENRDSLVVVHGRQGQAFLGPAVPSSIDRSELRQAIRELQSARSGPSARRDK
ncbi:MAG: DUF2188 domain-containing protein [Acidobacteriota bacterium]